MQFCATVHTATQRRQPAATGPKGGGGGTPGADITERDVMEREMLRSSSDRGDTDVAEPGSWGGAGGALLSGHPGEIQNPRKREGESAAHFGHRNACLPEKKVALFGLP